MTFHHLLGSFGEQNDSNAAAGFPVNNEQLVSHGSLSKIPNWKGRKTNNQIRKKWVFGTGSLCVDWAVRQTLRNGSDLSQTAQARMGRVGKRIKMSLC